MDRAFDLSDDVSCQGVPEIVRVTAPIPNYLGPTVSRSFVVCWMFVRYYSC